MHGAIAVKIVDAGKFARYWHSVLVDRKMLQAPVNAITPIPIGCLRHDLADPQLWYTRSEHHLRCRTVLPAPKARKI